MRIIKLLSSIIVLAMVITSCKSGMDLTKRHYTKGYYFHKSKSLDQPAEKEEVAVQNQKEKASKMETITPSLPAATYKVEFKGELKTTTAVNAFTKENAKKKQHVPAPIMEKKQNLFLKNTKSHSSIQQKNAKAKHAKGGGDANTIILVILCLFPFINLIPVYIHDGKSITTNFWITLLLDFLFFLPGIIFSILVVLDIVDLA